MKFKNNTASPIELAVTIRVFNSNTCEDVMINALTYQPTTTQTD